jgi:hypothetical protein
VLGLGAGGESEQGEQDLDHSRYPPPSVAGFRSRRLP